MPLLFDQGTEQGNKSEENNEHNSKVENQFLYTATCLKHCSSAAATENTTQTRTACLKQDKHDYRYTKNNLYDPNCWQPQLRQLLPRFQTSPMIGSKFIQ